MLYVGIMSVPRRVRLVSRAVGPGGLPESRSTRFFVTRSIHHTATVRPFRGGYVLPQLEGLSVEGVIVDRSEKEDLCVESSLGVPTAVSV